MAQVNWNAKLILRIVAGFLTLLSGGLVVARLYVLSAGGIATGTIMDTMRILFPLTMALFAGYIAVTGKIPFMDDEKQ